MKQNLNLILLLITFGVLLHCKSAISDQNKFSIKEEVNKMYEVDQIAAYIPQGKYKNYTRVEWEKFKDSVFTANTKKAIDIYERFGYPGFHILGEENDSKYWVVVQHSDKNLIFQKKILKALKKEVKNKNARPNHYALLYDRIKVNEGKKQMFGTQLTYNAKGQATPKIGLIDSINVDRYRSQYDLEPLKEYLNFMTERHFEMNKDILKSEGITEPVFYK